MRAFIFNMHVWCLVISGSAFFSFNFNFRLLLNRLFLQSNGREGCDIQSNSLWDMPFRSSLDQKWMGQCHLPNRPRVCFPLSQIISCFQFVLFFRKKMYKYISDLIVFSFVIVYSTMADFLLCLLFFSIIY